MKTMGLKHNSIFNNRFCLPLIGWFIGTLIIFLKLDFWLKGNTVHSYPINKIIL